MTHCVSTSERSKDIFKNIEAYLFLKTPQHKGLQYKQTWMMMVVVWMMVWMMTRMMTRMITKADCMEGVPRGVIAVGPHQTLGLEKAK